MAEQRGIGRGLAAILPERGQSGDELREVPVALIKPNPNQPRTRFDPEALDALAASIGASGVIQPLLVHSLPDGSYELIAGERRWRAAQQAAVDRVPVLIRDSDEGRRLETALIENMVREDLGPIEEAKACAALVEDLGLSKKDLGKRVGRSRSAISNLIRLLELPDEVIELLDARELSEGHGRAVLTVTGNDARRHFARSAVAAGWSVRETERRAKLAGQPKTKGKGNGSTERFDADARAAIADAEDRLEAALGHEVKVRAKGTSLKAELQFDDLDELLTMVRQLGPKRAA